MVPLTALEFQSFLRFCQEDLIFWLEPVIYETAAHLRFLFFKEGDKLNFFPIDKILIKLTVYCFELFPITVL